MMMMMNETGNLSQIRFLNGSDKNEKHRNLFCSICQDVNTTDSQEHMLTCTKLTLTDMDSVVGTVVPKYEDLFTSDITEQLAIANILEKKFKKRKELLSLLN